MSHGETVEREKYEHAVFIGTECNHALIAEQA